MPRTNQEVQHDITELKRRWPPHSAPPSMLAHLEELEAELQSLEAEHAQAQGSHRP